MGDHSAAIAGAGATTGTTGATAAIVTGATIPVAGIGIGIGTDPSGGMKGATATRGRATRSVGGGEAPARPLTTATGRTSGLGATGTEEEAPRRARYDSALCFPSLPKTKGEGRAFRGKEGERRMRACARARVRACHSYDYMCAVARVGLLAWDPRDALTRPLGLEETFIDDLAAELEIEPDRIGDIEARGGAIP